MTPWRLVDRFGVLAAILSVRTRFGKRAAALPRCPDTPRGECFRQRVRCQCGCFIATAKDAMLWSCIFCSARLPRSPSPSPSAAWKRACRRNAIRGFVTVPRRCSIAAARRREPVEEGFHEHRGDSRLAKSTRQSARAASGSTSSPSVPSGTADRTGAKCSPLLIVGVALSSFNYLRFPHMDAALFS